MRPATSPPSAVTSKISSRRSREASSTTAGAATVSSATIFFAEPAWDMLLDLYIQHHRGQPVAVDRLCAAAITSTTALRWLRLLIEKELVIRSSSAEEDGIVRVALSARGVGEMERYLRDFLHRDRLGGDIAAALSAR